MSVSPVLCGMTFPSEIRVRLVSDEEVLNLRREVQALTARLEGLQAEYDRLEYRYRCECIVNMELVDLCHAHGVPVRPSMPKHDNAG